jgi:putative sterol carrier protein
VVAFLSPAWIDALDEAFRDDPSLAGATADVALVIQQEVSNPDGPDDTWHVAIDHGSVRVAAGAAEHPDVVFRQDRATAVAVGRGELSAQTAFMIGKLRVDGNVGLLLQHHDLFDSVDDVFSAVRATTDY